MQIKRLIKASLQGVPAARPWIAQFIRRHPWLLYVRFRLAGISKLEPTLTTRRIYHYAQAGLAAKRNFPSRSERPQLAFVCPMPPQRTGVADLGARLVVELARYYDITVITPQEEFAGDWQQRVCAVQTPTWLRENFHQMDRILYHFGNSVFHQYMLTLIEEIPGAIALHDFFQSDLLCHLEHTDNGAEPFIWSKALYYGHGYQAVKKRFNDGDVKPSIEHYPANMPLLQNAVGVISHSQFAQQLAQRWYGEPLSLNWKVAPLWQNVPDVSLENARKAARQSLGIQDTDFLICSFGFLGASKLNHRLITAWAASTLARNEHARLVFVGGCHDEAYLNNLRSLIDQHRLQQSVHITGWSEQDNYRAYLFAADLSIQLRAFSRGESSGTIIDCMAYGLPVIANAHGSFAELPSDIVQLLADNFTDAELVIALEKLYGDQELRLALREKSCNYVKTNCTSSHCATLYAQALEDFYHDLALKHPGILVQNKVRRSKKTPVEEKLVKMAKSVAKKAPFRRGNPQVLLDITARDPSDVSVDLSRLESAYLGFRIEPVNLSFDSGLWHYRYARQSTLNLLNCPSTFLRDDVVEVNAGDLLVIPEVYPLLLDSRRSKLHRRWQKKGVEIIYEK